MVWLIRFCFCFLGLQQVKYFPFEISLGKWE